MDPQGETLRWRGITWGGGALCGKWSLAKVKVRVLSFEDLALLRWVCD